MNYGPAPSPYTASALEDHRARTRRRRLLLGGTAFVAVLLGVAVWGLAGGGGTASGSRPPAAAQAPDAVRETVEEPPKSVEGKLAFTYTEEIREVGAVVTADGTWATARTFAKAYGNQITGIRLRAAGGKAAEAWKLKLPGRICAVTRHVSAAGRTPVVYSSTASGTDTSTASACDRLALVDLDTGRKLWEAELFGDTPPAQANVTMTDGVVAIASDQGSAGYDMTEGKRLWTGTAPSSCADEGFAGGTGLLALLRCGDSAAPAFRVQKVDPRTGRSRWTYRVARGVQGVHLVSASPAVIAVAAGDVLTTDLISLGDRGRARGTIRIDRAHQQVDCDRPFSAVVESCTTVVVGERQLYLTTDDDVVAYDLTTGKSVFKFDSPSDSSSTVPLRMSGGRLIAYRAGGGFSPGAVVSLDPANRAETILLLFADSPDGELDGIDEPRNGDIVYEHGRIFFGARTVHGPTTKGEVGETATVAVAIESVA
ncbi:PQQ-binding-like beta-propeller repeat protein [Streptomyces sp. NPDC001388]|uniref:outer membrane protein assembly factor BamB family protein n=1 Tax=Streptomyces sp. NPDC001388 TaxID=3364568 RepID=UPI0036B6B519